MRRTAVAAFAAALALAGCGGGSDDNGGPAVGATTAVQGDAGRELSVREAKESGGKGLTLRGFVFVREEEWLLCNGLDQTSYPPVCLEPSLKVTNPDALAGLRLSKGIGQAGGLRWAARRVSLTGDVEGDAVTVSEIASP